MAPILYRPGKHSSPWYLADQTATSTTSTSLDKYIWASWNTTATSSSYYNNTWESWSYAYLNPSIYRPPRVETDAEVQARQVATASRREERKVAEARAEALLLQHLDDHQRKEWESKAEFHVKSQHGRRYCIKRGVQHNIFEVDNSGRKLVELCGHVADDVPVADNVLAQKLALEFTEDSFLRTCNRWDLRHGRSLVAA
jgi:hypothetical protein